ncbi:MAG: hypothetical protein II227_03535, partial [Clostridia bacterium]|nr:hypothetical protein [Clostridia bacterium]
RRLFHMNLLKILDVKKAGIFAAGVLFGTAGIKVLSSKDAKAQYVKWTAAKTARTSVLAAFL